MHFGIHQFQIVKNEIQEGENRLYVVPLEHPRGFHVHMDPHLLDKGQKLPQERRIQGGFPSGKGNAAIGIIKEVLSFNISSKSAEASQVLPTSLRALFIHSDTHFPHALHRSKSILTPSDLRMAFQNKHLCRQNRRHTSPYKKQPQCRVYGIQDSGTIYTSRGTL